MWDLSSSLSSPSLQFFGAIGISYSIIFGLNFFATLKQNQLIKKSSTMHKNTEMKIPKVCDYCFSKLKKLQQDASNSSSNNNKNNNNQLQLQIAVLLRLLQDREMIDENDNNTISSSDSSCCCPINLPNVPLPLLSVDSSATTFTSLQTPTNFFETLLKKVSNAKKRIVISSLYIGSGSRSQQLINAITDKLKSCPEIELLIVLDFCRMQCGNNLLAIRPIVEQICENAEITNAARNKNNSDDHENGGDVIGALSMNQRVSLFCSPSSIGQMVGKKFGRAREAQGVQHTKLLAFDDDVILTGANLSDDYFLDRMDRFILVEHHHDNNNNNSTVESAASSSPLANHVVSLAKTLASTAFNLVIVKNEKDEEHNKDNTRLCCNGTMKMLPNLFNVDPDRQNQEYVKVCETAMKQFEDSTSMPLEEWLRKLEEQMNGGDDLINRKNQTFIIPSQQFARAGVFSDMSVMETLLSFEVSSTSSFQKPDKHFQHNSKPIQRVIASPYLNTHEAFIEKMFQVCRGYQQQELTKNNTVGNNNNNNYSPPPPKLFRFITCSPNSNAWNGSRGLAGGLPQLYYSLVRSFFFLAEDRGFSDLVQIREFEKLHIVNRFGEPTGEGIPDGVSLGVFSPYMRPDAEDEAEEAKNKNKNTKSKESGYFPRSQSSAERLTSEEGQQIDEREKEEEDEKEKKRVANSTFHAKGVWIATAPGSSSSKNFHDEDEDEEDKNDKTSTTTTNSRLAISTLSAMSSDYDSEPFATVIGSNNLGERCVFKDVESDYLVITSDKRVQRTLADEVASILKFSKPVSRDSFVTNSEKQLGRFQPVVEVVGSLMSSYL